MADQFGSPTLRKSARSEPRPSERLESSVHREYWKRTPRRLHGYARFASSRAERRDEAEPVSPSLTGAKRRPSRQEHESFHSARSRYRSSNRSLLTSNLLSNVGYQDNDRRQNVHSGNRHYARSSNEAQIGRDENQRVPYRQMLEDQRQRRSKDHRERKRRKHDAERAPRAHTMPRDMTKEYGPNPVDPTRSSYHYSVGKQSVSSQALEYRSASCGQEDRSSGSARNVYGRTDTDYLCYGDRRARKRTLFVGILVLLLLAVIVVLVAVVNSKKHSSDNEYSKGTTSGPPNNNLRNVSRSSIPQWARGGYLDPFDWYDTLDFNVTFTDATVGGLYLMGLNSTWDDNTRANENVPALNERWNYDNMPFRGVNLGGWLSIEPFITPSLFSTFPTSAGIVDEWTLSKALGPSHAKSIIEEHYSKWVQESTFAEIQAAGFDHVRIPFSYWAVTTYDDDPYIPMISWRYLLRSIEWARKHGLRVNLDLHGAPGSQNGMNHSGHQGFIGWLNGTDGELNAQRTIDIHRQLSTFFAQSRYKNVITMYGLVNEPRMTLLAEQSVITWSKNAISAIRSCGYENLIVVGDGFLGLQNWQGQLQGIKGLVLDAHQYLIFDTTQLAWNHYQKIDYACVGWTEQAEKSIDITTGFGPTIFGEWSQSDTDCAKFLNDVGVGSRWTGTLNMGDTPGGATSESDFTPSCPTHNTECSCILANADPTSYTDEYKNWLLTFAEAQMYSFEVGWGWFYWTWETEDAPQWSYKAGLAAGILPKLAYKRNWNCTMEIPAFSSSVLAEYY